MRDYQEILDFWFGDGPTPPPAKRKLWFKKSEQTDRLIEQKFADTLERAAVGQLDGWADEDEGLVALVVVLDQFPRNIYRGTPRSFAYDEKARSLTHRAIDAGADLRLGPFKRQFLYLPLMHSEDLTEQKLSMKKYRELADGVAAEHKEHFETVYDFADRHFRIIQEWGRYPHRNDILGRQSSEAEEAFLTQPGSSF